MTQRQSTTINGYTWYYSGGPAAYPTIAVGVTVTGQAGVNTQFSGNYNDTLVGGGGGSDNIFYVGSTDIVVAGKGDGVDTEISYWGNLTLAAGVADGVINSAGTITGNAGDNVLTAYGSGAHTLVGGGGNDLLIGSAGATNRYVVSQTTGGNTTIAAFQHGSDVLELDSFSNFAGATGYAAVKAAMVQTGSNVVLNLGGGQDVTFANQTIAQFSATDFALPTSAAGLKLTFDDEFNSLNASANGVGTTWTFMSGTLSANHEAENYLPTAGAGSPFSDSGGVLDIQASPVSTAPGLSYTSGGLTTQTSFSQTYGLFEVRAQLTAGAGMWPAFWLVPADGSWPPELDAPEELGSDPTTLYFSDHTTTGPGQTVAVKTPDVSTGFHTYGVDWEPSTITYYLDGNAVATLATPSDMNKPMYLKLNLAVGGVGSWPGAAAGETGNLLVDWVRAYASATAVQPPLMLTSWGSWINQGNGNFTVGGTGGGGTIILGNGNQTVALTGAVVAGSHNHITTGDGNQSIMAVGNSNVIKAGAGTSTIAAGGSYNSVTVGATSVGTTHLSATGYCDVFTSTGAGNISVSGTTGQSTVTLADGNDSVAMGGGFNVVTLGNGSSVVLAGNGQNTVHTGAGSSVITVSGYNNILDAGPGSNVLNGGAGNDVFVLNAAGQGSDQINSFHVKNADLLDFSRAFAQIGVTPTVGNFGNYVTAAVTAAGTTLSIHPTGAGGSGQVLATLGGVSTSVSALLSAMDVRVGTHSL